MPLFQAITPQEKIDFTRNLSVLIKSGIPVNQSLIILANQLKPGALKKALETAKEGIEKGGSISETFAENSSFEPVFIGFIKAGEETGVLSENLEFLANWMEKKHQLDREMSRITLYPKIILSFALLLGSGLALFVLPQLVPVFSVLDVELPFTTRVLLAVSGFMRGYGWQFILGVFAFIAFLIFLSKLDKVKKVFHKMVFKIPVIGSLVKDYQLTMIAQLATTLVRSGSTIEKTLEIAQESITNFEYKNVLEEIRGRIIKGTSLSDSIRDYPEFFPGVFPAIVITGEETGTFSNSFEYLANFFSNRVREKSEKLPTIIEPVLLILIGLFVAFIASAIIMPIYEVTKGLY